MFPHEKSFDLRSMFDGNVKQRFICSRTTFGVFTKHSVDHFFTDSVQQKNLDLFKHLSLF